jgi:segregation and condensation protein B
VNVDELWPDEAIAAVEPEVLKRDVEALLFAAGEPLSPEVLLQALRLRDPEHRDIIETVLRDIADDFPPSGPRGIELGRLAGGWIFRTNPLSKDAIAALYELPAEAGRLSPAALECLAIIAYLQPVSRPQIAQVRGVNSDSPLRTLLDRELITDVGRAQGSGGAMLYATTPRFEAMFGLADLEELPPLEDFALSEDDKDELRRRLGLLTVPE